MTSPKPRTALIWITRAMPGAASTAERVRAMGREVLVEPLLEVRPAPGARLDLDGAAALAFTSANAVRAFAALSRERSLAVFAVGDATASAARAEGFANVESAAGDLAALAALLASRRDVLGDGPIVYPAPAAPAGDLAALAASAGIVVREAPLYETVRRPPPPALTRRLPSIDGVLLHSARAAGALAAFLQTHPAVHLTAFCLSAQVSEPLRRSRLAAVRVAGKPDERALLALLHSEADDDPAPRPSNPA
jgi:uroporphyrinogen-III synthase